jgi:GMP reductase
MRIETDIKLGFKDVMIRPKRSTLKSRSQVSLIRKFNFLHSDLTWEGIPIMAANMDTVGTFEMAKALGDHKLFTTIHKHYSPEEWKDFYLNDQAGIKDFIAVSSGTSPTDSEKLKTILSLCPN